MAQNKKTTEKKISTSQKIRDLYASGKTETEIAQKLKIRYQFVYNVLKRDRDKAELEKYRAQKK